MNKLECCGGFWKHTEDCLPGRTCTVLVADSTYQTALCGNTASFRCGVDLVCIFHRNSAVLSIPSSASAFEPLPVEEQPESLERQRFLAAFRGPRGPL